MNIATSNIKTLLVPSPETGVKIIQKKEKKKRVIVSQPKWVHANHEQQCLFLEQQEMNGETSSPTNLERLFFQQMERKLAGYKSQDVKKNRYSPTQFISISDLLNLLKTSELICQYCREPVHILYEYVRDPKQWSLDRIDNSRGHNSDNVCVACLSCNLRRKTIHYERYHLAKQQQFCFVKLPAVVEVGGETDEEKFSEINTKEFLAP